MVEPPSDCLRKRYDAIGTHLPCDRRTASTESKKEDGKDTVLEMESFYFLGKLFGSPSCVLIAGMLGAQDGTIMTCIIMNLRIMDGKW